jgi:methionine biosynthesis protein MetW
MKEKPFLSKYEIEMDPEAPHANRRLSAALHLLKRFHIQGNSILDIGCSNGKYTEKISKAIRASTIYGIDLNEKALESAQLRGIVIFNTDIDKENLPFDDNSIDFVYCAEVIEHVVNTDKLLSEILRILKPNGHLLITTPNLASWLNRIILLLGWQPIYSEVSFVKYYGTPFGYKHGTPVGHVRLFTWPAFKQFLVDKGFRISKVVGYASLEHPFLKLLDLAISPSSTCMATGFICLCIK